MKLTDFRQLIPKAILARGVEYQKNSRVLEVSEESDGVWRAEVQGDEIYVVRVETIERGELECMCTCPNDEDDVCEHVAAVLLTLETLMLEGAIGKSKKRKTPAVKQKKETRPQRLRRLLGRLPPEALVELVLKLAEEDTALFNRLLLQVDDERATAADYRRIIKDALRAGRGSTGYVTSTGAKRVAGIVSSLLDQAEEGLRNGLTAQPTLIVQTVLDELNAAVGQVNDRNEHLEVPYQRSLALLTQIAKSARESERTAMLSYLLDKGRAAMSTHLTSGWEMLALAVDLVSNPQEAAVLSGALAALEKEYSRYLGWGGGYIAGYERCLELSMTLARRFGGAKAEREYMLAHRQAPSIRKALIKLYLEENEPGRALQLIEEGVADDQRYGHTNLEDRREYRKLQATLLKEMGDTAGQIKLAREVWLDSRVQSDFAELKALVPLADWPVYRKDLAAYIRPDKLALLQLWAAEGEWREVLRIVRSEPSRISQYRQPLEQHFPAEMVALYEQQIDKRLAQPNSYYDGEIAVFIQYIQQMGHQQKADDLIAAILELYPKRRNLQKALLALQGAR